MTILVASCLFSACSDWLDIHPHDKVLDDKIFSSEVGIQEALNGLYLTMGNSDLYGNYMTQTTVEILAQRYLIETNMIDGDPNAYYLASYSYSEEAPKALFFSIWEKMYNLIFDTNYFIQKVETTNGILTAEKKRWILGEAYALRAYVHFDIFRLYGTIYSDNPDEKLVPYYDEVGVAVKRPISGTDFLKKTLEDIDLALEYLDTDPVLTKGVMVGDDYHDDFWTYRNRRMNSYAVSALKARVLLYKGEKTEAADLASQLLQSDQIPQKFPWIDLNLVNRALEEDYILSSEVIFGIHCGKMQELYAQKFSPGISTNAVYAIANDNVTYMFDAGNGGIPSVSDIRTSYLSPQMGGKKYNTVKFSRSDRETDNWYFQPLIRKSELYYILAEVNRDIEPLNEVRVARNLLPLEGITEDLVEEEVTKEFMKEFIQEGQLFFYYKRKNMETIRSNSGSAYNMSANQYVVPIPEEELDYLITE